MNAYLSWVAFYYEIPFSVLDVINLWPKNNLKNLEQVCDFHNLMTHSEKKTKNKAELERILYSSFPLDKQLSKLLVQSKSLFTSFSFSWQKTCLDPCLLGNLTLKSHLPGRKVILSKKTRQHFFEPCKDP